MVPWKGYRGKPDLLRKWHYAKRVYIAAIFDVVEAHILWRRVHMNVLSWQQAVRDFFLLYTYMFCWVSLEGRRKRRVFCISAQDMPTYKLLFIMYIELFCVTSTRLWKEKKKGRSPVHCVKRIEDKLLPERNPYQKYRKSPEVLWVKSSQRIMYLENCTYCVHSSQCPALYIYFQKIYIYIHIHICSHTKRNTWLAQQFRSPKVRSANKVKQRLHNTRASQICNFFTLLSAQGGKYMLSDKQVLQ